jgi:hypothetical protein
VQSVTGVDNVCERSARAGRAGAAAADCGKKIAGGGVTMPLAAEALRGFLNLEMAG